MRKMLLTFILLPLFANSQRQEYIVAFEKSIPAGLGKSIHLPEPGYSPSFTLDNIADYFIKQRVWVIADDSVLRKIFWQYRFTMDSVYKYAPDKNSGYHQWLIKHLRDSIPEIDFSTQELVLYSACGQCLAYCNHDENESCHRNACNFMYRWFLRNKQKEIVNEKKSKRNFLDALYGYPPDTLYNPVSLPFGHQTNFHKYFEVGKKSVYLYQVTDSVYYKVFDWHIRNSVASMPVIDFKKQEVWVRIACHQCLVSCNYNNTGWNNTPCHRNACRYSYSWFLKEKSSGN